MAALADEIWHQHYADILQKAQIDYMVEHFQSEAALTEQIEQQGYRYLLAVDSESDTPCGFCGYHREEENGRMFISKIYIRQAFRRQGIAGQFLQEVLKRSQGLGSVYLTVNKYNTGSIEAYRHLGFKTVDSAVTDIGNGYVMDDYIMQRKLPAEQ